VLTRLCREVGEARELGGYRLTERLGKGGMGEVWRGSHRLLAREAAVKIIKPEILGGEGERRERTLLRFEREAQATARLHSPHTIELYDFGVSNEGTFYYVMELLDGLDLETLVRRFGPVAPERAISLLRQVCHSLADAHAAGLIHRDIKPANIFTCRRGLDLDFVKVLDFGLVKGSPAGWEGEALLSDEKTVKGTPAFMAPESLRGGEVDGRADLYALGCVAFWLLTGRLVFEGENAMDVLAKHLSEEPDPPSIWSEIDVPPELDQVVLACLRKRPGERPQSARELSEMLARCPLPSSWTGERAVEWWSVNLPRREEA
jgi:serine/threonine-protein kinase